MFCSIKSIILIYQIFFLYIDLTFFPRSSALVLTSICLALFEVTFSFKFFSLSSKSVFFTKSAILVLLAKFACVNLAAKFSDVDLLNS